MIKNYSKAYTEVSEILKYVGEDLKSKIPQKFLDKIETEKRY